MKAKIDKIRKECGRLNWGIKKLALEAGVSRQTIYNLWETPEKFNPNTIMRIAKALNLDAKDLIS